jgi:hypothetical protein
MMDTSNLNKLELKDLLRRIKMMSSLRKSLWKRRWVSEYNRLTKWENFYKVEYSDFWENGLSYFKWISISLFDKLFWITITESDISFISNKNLTWGVRIFFNDNMYDLSYSRFEKLLK